MNRLGGRAAMVMAFGMALEVMAAAGVVQAAETDSRGTFSVAGHESSFPVARCGVSVMPGEGWKVGVYGEGEDDSKFAVVIQDTTARHDYQRVQSAEIKTAGGETYLALYHLKDKVWTGTNDQGSESLVSYSLGRVTVDGRFRVRGDFAGTVDGHIEVDCPALDAKTVALLNGDRELPTGGEASGTVEIAGSSAEFKPRCRLIKMGDSILLSIHGDGPGVNVSVMAANPSKIEGVKTITIHFKNGGPSWTGRQGIDRKDDEKQADAKPLVVLDGHHVVVDGTFERSRAEGSAHGHLEANCPKMQTLTAG